MLKWAESNTCEWVGVTKYTYNLLKSAEPLTMSKYSTYLKSLIYQFWILLFITNMSKGRGERTDA